MAARMCMARNEVDDFLLLLKIGYRKWMEKFEGTDALRFHLYVMSFLMFQELFFMELRQNAYIIVIFAHDRYRKC